ncbi:MAG: aminodeoxychorismate synthase component I [Gemmatimonadales bacterium]|nr:aminodeoxychorismate synthase component I [Gemmatimonadales bacterium]
MASKLTHTRSITRDLDPLILGDLPFWRFAALFQSSGHSFLLDSALADGKLGRFSFLGGEPVAVLTAHRIPATTGQSNSNSNISSFNISHSTASCLTARLTVTRWKSPEGRRLQKPEIRVCDNDPFTAIRDLQKEYWPEDHTSSPEDPSPPFGSGLVGYFGYEAGHFLEQIPDTGQDDLQLPDLAFMAVDEVLVLDNQTGRLAVTVTGRGSDPEKAMTDAKAKADYWPQKLTQFGNGIGKETGEESVTSAPPRGIPRTIRAHFDRESYCAAVQKCRDHILCGDAFEICLTHRLEMDQPSPAWDIYRVLREVNPAPFASYLQFPDFQVVGASPERFLRLDENRLAESRPIKGTRPRGKNPEQDQRLRRELAESAKDRAENLMIVDLVRSDLGKVAKIGSVEVPELLTVEDYATVFQLVSTVRAELRPDCDALDLVQACYPGGSMTGAPKIEAMKIIDSIEPVSRGVYSGAIGYMDHSGRMDLSIVIRTIVCKDGRCTFGVGGAVVADSDPAEEYQETLDKARALIESLNAVNDPPATTADAFPAKGEMP